MPSDWDQSSPDPQHALAAEALRRASLIISAQAQLLADQMDRGTLPTFDGPDALRLLAMLLGQDDEPPTPAHHLTPAFSPAYA